jgi:fatty acid desaturase
MKYIKWKYIIGYFACFLPLTAFGIIPPFLALGMVICVVLSFRDMKPQKKEGFR